MYIYSSISLNMGKSGGQEYKEIHEKITIIIANSFAKIKSIS